MPPFIRRWPLVRGGGQVLLFAHTKRAAPVEGREPRAESQTLVESRKSSVESKSMRARRDAETALDPRPSALDQFGPRPSTLDFSSICLDEKDLIGSYSSDFTLQAEVARLVFSRRLDVRPLLSHRFPLEQTAAAIQLAANPQPDSLKILVQIAPE